MVTLDAAKHSMRIDFDDDDELIESYIDATTQMCSDILGGAVPDDEVLVDQAIIMGTSYLYENRETPNVRQLKLTMRDILVDLRKGGF